MPHQPLTIWCNMKFPQAAVQALVDGTRDHQLLFAPNLQASNLVAGAVDPRMAEAQVIFGQPDPQSILNLPQLRWVHLTSAGYERYDRPEVRKAFQSRDAMITNSSWVYEEPCAEHVLAMMMALARQLPEAWNEQNGARGWPAKEIRARSRLLAGQTVLILGYGAIARRLIELLAPFRVKIFVVRRKVTGNELMPAYTENEIDQLLPQADHVVNILPGGEATTGFMNAHRIDLMRRNAYFYNIGRGGTVDQAALVAALQEKKIAGAYLDVTSPEPLPLQSPLWSMKNCWITPHTAGGHDDEFLRLVRHFLANLGRYITAQPLADRVI